MNKQRPNRARLFVLESIKSRAAFKAACPRPSRADVAESTPLSEPDGTGRRIVALVIER